MSDREERRRPTLADRFIHRRYADWERAVHPRAIARLQKATRDAHRFVLTEDAVLRIGQIIIDIPDLLVREHRFARAPYDLTWIEFPSHVLWNLMREQNPGAYEGLGKFGSVEDSDHTVGYLIDHERINVICGGTVAQPDQQPNIMPIQYRLQTPWEPTEVGEFMRLTGMRDTRDVHAFLWGSTWSNIPAEHQLALAMTNAVDFLPLNPVHQNYPKFSQDGQWWEAARGCIGELRNVIAILLVMNRPSLTNYIRTNAPGRGFHKGKLMPYLSHTTVTIDLDARPTLRLIGTPAGETIARRRHEVKGHYKHDQTARDYSRIAGCIHAFAPTHGPEDDWAPWPDAPLGIPGEPGTVRNWVCSECGGKRWWQKDHGRGTAEKGFVAHDLYEVGAT
jgi:hypothetical protein